MDPGAGPAGPSDVRLCGYLRKQKSRRRRFFVLRCAGEGGPARLEYYKNEKKFRAGGAGARPRRSFPLASALSIGKRVDARDRHLIVLCGRGGTFGVAAESAEQQEEWLSALLELHGKGTAALEGDREAAPVPGPAFREVWQVAVRPRGLGHSKNLAGPYLLCLAERTVAFVRSSAAAATVVLQLLSVRRCGHAENHFFMEVGRSAATGPGELWMQVEDLVVARHMHETILEAMKALSDEFRVRSKSLARASTPIPVPARRQPPSAPPAGQAAFPWRPRAPEGPPSLSQSPGAPGPKVPSGPRKPDSLSDYSAISSDEGGSSPGDSRPPSALDPLGYMLGESALDRVPAGTLPPPDGPFLASWASGAEPSKRASLPAPALEMGAPSPPHWSPVPVAGSASVPEGLNLRGAEPCYVAMWPRGAAGAEDRDYVPMTPGSPSPPRESGGYMLMSPSGSCSPEGPGPWGPGAGREAQFPGDDYVNMLPGSWPASCTPPEHGPPPAAPGAAPFLSLPRSYKHPPRPPPHPFDPGRLSRWASSSESQEGPLGAPCRPPSPAVGTRPAAARSPGDYVRLEFCRQGPERFGTDPPAGPDGCAEMAPTLRPVQTHPQGSRRPRSETFPVAERSGAPAEGGLNYIDLDLAKEAGLEAAPAPHPPPTHSPGGPLHTYASIDFHRLGEPSGGRTGTEGPGPGEGPRGALGLLLGGGAPSLWAAHPEAPGQGSLFQGGGRGGAG